MACISAAVIGVSVTPAPDRPSSLVLSAADIRPAVDRVAVAVLALPANADVMTLFWTGLVLVVDSALSTSIVPPPPPEGDDPEGPLSDVL